MAATVITILRRLSMQQILPTNYSSRHRQLPVAQTTTTTHSRATATEAGTTRTVPTPIKIIHRATEAAMGTQLAAASTPRTDKAAANSLQQEEAPTTTRNPASSTAARAIANSDKRGQREKV
jgi:hypothetical protein